MPRRFLHNLLMNDLVTKGPMATLNKSIFGLRRDLWQKFLFLARFGFFSSMALPNKFASLWIKERKNKLPLRNVNLRKIALSYLKYKVISKIAS